ncbi:LysR family transcriptional regulator [Pseudalkalibacillus decolorationis]|uniref:LysR family transcriptional regulator n=1 Tax=Pseudalkalibacillus decolorationis TaxID=163879 RepID=UPI002148C73F|nr:LysR family transcriptional regulator [Pseudalkalibacillus decolorationis]
MNLHALRIFTEVAKSGSVTRTAEKLLISQPAITAQLRNIEKEIGIKLVTSKGRSIQLTEAGEILASDSIRLFSIERELEKKMHDIKTGMKGSLRICTTHLPASTLLPNWIAAFKENYPLVDVQLFKRSSYETIQSLLNHSVHIGLVCGEWKAEEIDHDTIFEDELVFVVSENNPLHRKETSLKELMKQPLILREKGSSTRKKLSILCDTLNIDQPEAGILIEGMSESIEFAKAGLGVALVPQLAVKDELLRGGLGKVYVNGVSIKLPISICKRKHEDLPSTAANFISLIKAGSRDN